MLYTALVGILPGYPAVNCAHDTVSNRALPRNKTATIKRYPRRCKLGGFDVDVAS